MSLRFVDIVFFLAVLVLIILIISLIYFIKINKEENNDETREMQIVKELQENMKNNNAININFTEYEKDQEDKAIISYDELLNKGNHYGLNYETEEVYDDLIVKKVDLDNIGSEIKTTEPNVEARVISFAKEEAFLQALKQLQKELS